MLFSTQHLREVFAEEGKFENFRRLRYNLVRGNDIFEYDDNGNEKKVSKRAANEACRKVLLEVLGLNEITINSRKQRERAMRLHWAEVFEIIEEDIDFKINEGFNVSEWFNELVDQRNIAHGDGYEFKTDGNVLYVVADVSGDNHDITMQQLPEGSTFTVKVSAHAIKIGKDIDLVLLGRIDYTEMVDRISKSFIQDIQQTTYDAVVSAADKLPSGDMFKKTGALSSATKEGFDELIENVSVANGSDVVILGTKSALKKLTALADVDWAAETQKQSIADTGRLGSYEGTALVEIPQKFKRGTFEKLIPNNILYFMPVTEDKFVKFVDEGETEIFEVTDKAELQDDFQTYEVQRRYGAAVILGQYFGMWTIE